MLPKTGGTSLTSSFCLAPLFGGPQVKQAIAREAAKGHMKWEQAVLDALKLSRDDVTSLSEEEAQVHAGGPRRWVVDKGWP